MGINKLVANDSGENKLFRTYALAPETIRRFLKRMFWRFQLIVTASFLGFGLFLFWTNSPIQLSKVIPITLIIALAYFLLIYLNYRQQMRILYSVRYELDDSAIIFRQFRQNPVRLMRADILHVKARKDGLWIDAVDAKMNLLIPYGLAREGDQDFLQTLDTWVGVDRQVGEKTNLRLWLLLGGFVATLIILLFVNTISFILPLGVGLAIFGFYTERRLEQKHPAPPGVVRMYSMAFTFMIFVIVMKSCLLGLSAVGR